MQTLNDIKPSLQNLTDGKFGKLRDNQHAPLQELTKPHIDSFNTFLRTGIHQIIPHIQTEFELPDGKQIMLNIKAINIAKPEVECGKDVAAFGAEPMFPRECRQRALSYNGKVMIDVGWRINGVEQYPSIERCIGSTPIMVKSDHCHLSGLNPTQLVKRGEEAEELGGYFIVNGIERIIRMLIMQRRNYPMAIERPRWKDKGAHYTEYGIIIRCVREDQTTSTMTLHYLTSGSPKLSFQHNKEQFYIPIMIILRALSKECDYYIYKQLTAGIEDDQFVTSCVRNMLREMYTEHEGDLSTQKKVMNYIGKLFRVKLDIPKWYTNEKVTEYLLRKCVCIHLSSDRDKFDLLVYMTRKLFAYAKNKCSSESADNLMFHEILIPGHLYQMYFKERLEHWLQMVRMNILKSMGKKNTKTINAQFVNEAARNAGDITSQMTTMIATGNLSSKTGLGLMQASGMTVVADKLNFYRYISHFRAVHRGAFFTTMRTTEVRKLLPETWGFLCPVHTPDGSPCGLLNHMAFTTEVVTAPFINVQVQRQLVALGVVPYDGILFKPHKEFYPVMVDGKLVGWLHDSLAESVASQLRYLKVKSEEGISKTIEICLVPKRNVPAQYPGLFIFSSTARMVRPVFNLALNEIEMVGTFEQVYMGGICVDIKEANTNTTHQELNRFVTLSEIAALTPFSNYNQSCRNMYQCQMGKQTMGVPLHAWKYRSDNKLYRITYPQTTVVRTAMYDYLDMDDYPLGTNAIVAVMSYTGYDMEDAMVINKGSYDRGFSHGSIYKNIVANLRYHSGENKKVIYGFGADLADPKVNGRLDVDGLPHPGTIIQLNDPLYSYMNLETGQYTVQTYHYDEPIHVLDVIMCTDAVSVKIPQRAVISVRIQRNPVIGDKFSSRHGQKGVCSQFYPPEDMPFTVSGMSPDIIFNPHGFPSRMTIGMMIEILAGKSAALHGVVHDASPFLYNESNDPVEYFGECLSKAGFNYHGTEVMYSGIKGNILKAYIFKGVVYYQRLRHMVLDKWQVRTTGPVDPITQQPVGGRKKGGGVRFGEMERDALIAHGAAFLLHDRLLNCSDASQMPVCTQCGSILSPIYGPSLKNKFGKTTSSYEWRCTVCPDNPKVGVIKAPYVLRYLIAELAAMNIKIKFDVRPS